jgi:hypothetical protein
MSENLDKVTTTYKECSYFTMSTISNKWLNFGISDSTFKDINEKCINLSLNLQECVVKCKSNLDWKDQKECWKKCILE